MKITLLTLILMLAFGERGRTQGTCSKATWVIEAAREKAKIQTVKFYNEKDELIYQETVNKRLNPSRKKVQQALNRVLDSLLTANHAVADNTILAATFKLKR